jgi:hypothetical protein
MEARSENQISQFLVLFFKIGTLVNGLLEGRHWNMYTNEFLRTSVDVMLQSLFFFTLIGTELIHMIFFPF